MFFLFAFVVQRERGWGLDIIESSGGVSGRRETQSPQERLSDRNVSLPSCVVFVVRPGTKTVKEGSRNI